jgi:hypothetical protein
LGGGAVRIVSILGRVVGASDRAAGVSVVGIAIGGCSGPTKATDDGTGGGAVSTSKDAADDSASEGAYAAAVKLFVCAGAENGEEGKRAKKDDVFSGNIHGQIKVEVRRKGMNETIGSSGLEGRRG